MTRAIQFAKTHPVLIYFVLTFAISWGAVLAVVGGPGNILTPSADVDSLLPLAIAAMLAGPTIASILMTGIVYGREGFRVLLSRLSRWRVSWKWYAIALLGAPLVIVAVYLALSLADRAFLPGLLTTDDWASPLVFGLVAGLLVGLLEELGWTGFATPTLRRHHGAWATALFVGVLWGAWHLLTNLLWGSGAYSGVLTLPLYLAVRGLGFLVAQLPAYRVLMVWVFERTGSLLVAVLMHASLTAGTFFFMPADLSQDALLLGDFGFGAAMWLAVAVVAVVSRGRLSPGVTRCKVVER